MERKVKNGKVVLNGTKAKYQIEREIFQEFEQIESVEEKMCIKVADYFKIFEQKDVWAFDNNYLPQKNRVVYVDTYQHKITIHNGIALRTYEFKQLNNMWFFTKGDCLNKRNEVLESGKKSKNKE